MTSAHGNGCDDISRLERMLILVIGRQTGGRRIAYWAVVV